MKYFQEFDRLVIILKNMLKIPLNQLIEIGVKNNQLSQYMFKYRTLDSTSKILENNSLWFSTPNEFNDPFDCQIVPNTNNSLLEIENFLRQNSEEKLNENQIKNLAIEAYSTPGKWKSIIEDTFDKIINKTGICCFTKNEKSLLMWSHYADSHKGVCLKFNILEDPDFFVYPLPVNYRDEYPDYNHLGDRRTLVNDIVLSKSNDWIYEQEIRVLKINSNGLLNFKKNALVEIIFGCKTPSDKMEKIMALSKEKGFDLKFKQAQKKDREFALEIIDL